MAGNDILSRIQVLLDANTANFEQGMRNAQNTADSSFKKIRESANKMGKWVAGASVAAVGGLTAMAVAQAEQAKQIEIAAYKSQASTTEIQKYGVAAKQVGLETEQLADIYKDFNEKLGEFVTVGGGGAMDFFEQVALKTEGSAEGAMKLARKMAALSGPEAMGLYVAKLEEANVSQDQMSFFLESAASEATLLLPLYKNNAEQVKLWGDAAERTGMILDEQGIKKAAEFRVQSELLQMQLEGAKTQLVQAVIPAFVDISDAFNAGDKNARAMASGGEVLANVLRGVAAIAIGVYTTVNLVANSIAGLAASSMSAMDLAEREAQAKNANWWDKLPAVKMFKASVMIGYDIQSPDGIIADMQDQNAKIAEQGAAMINKVFDDSISAATAKMSSLYDSLASQQAKATAGADDWVTKQNEAASATSAATDALKKQQEQLRIQISQRYASDYQNIEWSETDELKRVREAGFGVETAKYEQLVTQHFAMERAEFFKSLNLELNQYKWTEDEKLKYAYEMDREIAENNVRLGDVVKKARLAFLDEQYQYQSEMAKLNKAQELLELRSYHMTELDFIRQSEALKRQEIEKTLGISDEERQARLGRLDYDTFSQIGNVRDDAMQDLISMRGDLAGTSQYQGLQAQFDNRMEILKANLLAENLTTEEFLKQRAEITEAYNIAEAQLNLSYGEQITSSMTESLGTLFGKQTGIYKAMFAANKAFSIAQSLISIKTGIAQAASLAFPLNLAAMAQVAMSTASIVSDIQSVKLAIDGQAHDGIDKVPADGTWLLKKNERVTTERTSAKLDRTLDEVRSGYTAHGNINIYNNTSAQVTATHESDGSISIDIVERVATEAANKAVRGAFSRLGGDPNSFESKQTRRGFNVKVSR